MKNLYKIAKAYALKNAVAHNGKAQVGSVIPGLFNEGLKRSDVGKHSKKINEIVSEINSMELEEQKKEFEKLRGLVSARPEREGLPELPNARKGKVVMRFAPSASGPMHVGHALTASISFLFIQEYEGKFFVRVEDTNPENIYPKAYKLLKEDSDWLFKKKAKFVIQSDNIKIYYRYAEKLINKKSAYVCTCSSEKFREFAKKKKKCPCRSKSIKENLKDWKRMLDKKGFRQGEAILRFKTPRPGMSHKNPAMRDFPLARINETEHEKTGKKYRVWPLMNLAVAVDDIEQGMTHVIRAKDHRDNALRQKMIYQALGLGKRFPWIGFLGRIHFKDLELSTTKFKQGIKEGKFKGWDDPKLPTLKSLKKQGYKPEAFWKFAERIGFSENDKILNKKEFFILLDEFNKDY